MFLCFLGLGCSCFRKDSNCLKLNDLDLHNYTEIVYAKYISFIDYGLRYVENRLTERGY